MALPSSGQLSLKDILDEKQGSTTARTDISLQGLSVDGTADSSGGDISGTPNSTAPYSVSEFYSYSQATIDWNVPTLGSLYAPSANFTESYVKQDATTAYATIAVKTTWNQNGSHTAQFLDGVNSSTPSGTYSTAQSITTQLDGSNSTSGITHFEARWILRKVSFTMDGGAGDHIDAVYPTGSDTLIRNASQGNATNQDFTDSWRNVRPYAFGGSVANSQVYYLRAEAFDTSQNGDQAKVLADSTGANYYFGLQFRINQDNNKIITIRNNLSTTALLSAFSFERPESTCIMPNMFVRAESGWKRIGDVVVGDRILAQGDLNNPDVEPIYVDVNEARTHTRSGYWDVNGIHITNDHPVWLTDETGSEWVTVDNMRDGISRTYVDGSVDPVYLGTNPGHFYVFSEDKQKVFTVSGDYAPTTD